jgi:predicted DNA-binding antitoxin AbrB/MazE fold protein
MTVNAVYENGVFRPTGPVELPEGAAVRFVPEVVPPGLPPEPDGHRERLIAILTRSVDTGEPELAARHNEHQP